MQRSALKTVRSAGSGCLATLRMKSRLMNADVSFVHHDSRKGVQPNSVPKLCCNGKCGTLTVSRRTVKMTRAIRMILVMRSFCVMASIDGTSPFGISFDASEFNPINTSSDTDILRSR